MACYYVDSYLGNDNFSGTSPEAPWYSLNKANSVMLQPGDSLLFRRGGVWVGKLSPKGSGTEGAPITLGAYSEGAKPCICGGGRSGMEEGMAVLLYNQDYWVIEDLDISNDAPDEADRWGMVVRWNDYGVGGHVHIRRCDIHDIAGRARDRRFKGDGLLIVATGCTIPTGYDYILVEDCTFINIRRTALTVWSQWTERGRVYFRGGREYSYHTSVGPWFGNTNVVIRNNFIKDIAGDGILVTTTKGCIVEHNVAENCNNYNGAHFNDPNVAIWPQNSDDFLMQYNEAFGTGSTADGQGYDIDFECYRPIVQYNYSHDNEGGFILVMDEVYDAVIRYNISENDHCALFDVRSPFNMQVYNNTFYMGCKEIIRPGRSSKNGLFANNIFYSPVGCAPSEWGDYTWQNNCYFQVIPNEGQQQPLLADPQFIRGGQAGRGKEGLPGYVLKPDSPCIGAGISVENHCEQDIFGRPIPKKPSIGAAEPHG
ncbi:MAG: right-handed parallel beta-helix repeat-containing protein [Christensenellales bacterium]|jgi:hypothetical protein